jgi:hypothetical protein
MEVSLSVEPVRIAALAIGRRKSVAQAAFRPGALGDPLDKPDAVVQRDVMDRGL